MTTVSVKLPTLIRTVSPSSGSVGSVIVTPAAVTVTCSPTAIVSFTPVLVRENG